MSTEENKNYEKQFCVINPLVDAQRVARTWKDTQEQAEAHARRLILSSHEREGGKRTTRLLVVQVVSVVETEPRVRITVRKPTVDDVTPITGGDE